MPVAEDDQLAHPRGRLVPVDRVGPAQIEDRLDGDLGVADPLLDQGESGGAEPLDRARAQVPPGAAAVGGEVGQVQVEVEPGAVSAGRCTTADLMPAE
ncbi:hypothetical protein GCM10027601_00760 [Nocardioides ungokensis]